MMTPQSNASASPPNTRFRLETVRQDLKFAFRSFRSSPGFFLVAVATLALGIGANTAIFSLVHGVFLQPLPYQEGSQLVVVRQKAPLAGLENVLFSVKEVYDYRDQVRGLSNLVEHHAMTFTLLGRDEPQRVSVGVVSADFFQTLGVQPHLGRAFDNADDELGAEAVLILSHAYWQQSFGGDPEILGKSFEMNDKPHMVVGVLPPIPQFPIEHDVYMPTSACPFRAAGERAMEENRSAFRAMTVFGRIAEGESLDSARSDLSAIARRFEQDFPETYSPERGYAVQATPLQAELTQGAGATLGTLLATAALVLLIGCVNVANLFVARMMRRSKELAIRTSVGASRARLLQQTLTESVLVGLAGGIVGFALATLTLDMLVTFTARLTPRAANIEMNGTILLFTALVSLATGLVFGLLPALQGDGQLVEALREGGSQSASRRKARLRSALVAIEVGVAAVLLVTAGLMIQSLYRLTQVDPGFDSENLVSARLARNWSRYQNLDDSNQFFSRLLRELRSKPGVISAAVANARPLAGQQPLTSSLIVEGGDERTTTQSELAAQIVFRNASVDYFRTMGIPLLQGRTFSDGDDPESPQVAVINQRLASEHFREQDPIGRRISLNGGDTWMTIVGIVGDVRQQGLAMEPVAAVYGAQTQSFWAQTLVLRTRTDPSALSQTIKKTVFQIDPEQPVDHFESLEQTRRSSIAEPRLTVILLALFAALAMLITITGIAGVIAYSVTQRIQEIGIRLALGASRFRVLELITRQGLTMVAIGLGAGIGITLLSSHLLESLLFETSARDPWTIGLVALVLGLVATLASLVPAWRATRISPTTALRAE